MKKNLISLPISTPTLIHNFLLKQNFKPISFGQFHIFIILFFVYTSLTAQQHTFTTAGNTVEVPAGVIEMDVKAWGAGGAGGGASNAPILDGRTGAGGGGGAYATSKITVVAGTTLSVVVGLATTGTVNNGVAGGNSTITGFESSILALGGQGGEANSTGTIPLGGAGGSLSGSVGTTKAAGISGGNGTSGLLSLGISTGAGGAGGGPGGGAGGASVTSLLLLNQAGNPGATLGGGGSGGINSSVLIFTGPPQVGGNGAHGQVIIDYTCPTYSLTATTAAIACLSPGTSEITLTSSTGGLPKGNYTVTYTRGATTGLTASMTVTTAGTGKFTVSGLTPAGTINVKITALKSGVCNSPITANNSVDVTIAPVTVGGTVSGGTTICGGSTSAVLTLSGHVGSILRWESLTAPSSTWVTIPNTTTTYTSGALAATTQFRAVVQSGTCSVLNSIATTVTVNTQPSITLGTINPLCVSASAQSPVLTYSNAVASPTLYNITWASSPTNSFVAVPDTSLPSQITIAVPAGTASGTYTGTLRVKNATGCISSPVNFNVVVNPLPSITLGTIASVCTNANAQTTQLNYTAATNSPTTYSIAWNASPTNSFVAVTNAGLSASPITINVPAGTASGTYTGALTVRNANGCVSSSTNFNVVVNPLPSITLGTIVPVCTNVSAQTTQLNYTAATNSPTTYSITWNASPANSFAAVTNAGLSASPITINVPAGTAAGTYAGTLTVSNGNGCVSSASNFNVVVNPLPSITLGTIVPVCTNVSAQTTQLNYTAATNSPTTYSITWNASPTNSFAPVTNAGLSSSPIAIAIPAGTPAGTYTGTLTVNNANGCASTPSNFNVVVNPVSSITLGTLAPICTNVSAQTTQLNYTAATNSPTTYSITWNASPANSFAPVTNAGLPSSPIPIDVPAGTAAGTYTGTLTVSNGNGCASSASNFNVVVNPLPSITLGTIAPVCANVSAQTAQLNYTAATASPTTYSIVWNASPANSFAPVINAGLSTSPITINIPAGTDAGTYTGTLTVSNANGCVSSDANFNLVVNPQASITLGAIAPVCSSANAQTTQLNYTAPIASPTTYSIVWNSVPANSFVTVTNAGLSSSPITINVPAGTPAGTYTGTLTVNNANGCISSDANFNVIVNPLPSITLGTIAPVCASASAQTAQLNYTAATNAPTTYSIVWNSVPANSFVTVTNAALSSSPIIIDVPAGSAVGTYIGTLTVSNANGCISSSSSNFNVVVNPLPATPVPGATTQTNCVSATGSVMLTGLIPSITWTITQSGTFSNTYTGTGTSYLVQNLATGTYTFTVRDGTNCPSLPTSGVVISPPSTNTWNGSTWSTGSPPTNSDAIVFAGNYTTTGSLVGCSCVVNSGVTVTVNPNHTLTISNSVSNNGGTLIFENDASLVQTSNAVNTGNIFYKRTAPSLRRYDLTYWSSPVTRNPIFKLRDLSPGTLGDKYYKYDPIVDWIIVYNGSEEMVKGYGYNIRAPQTYDINTPAPFYGLFIGVPNNGPVSIPLGGLDKWQLLGNPYPSAVYANQFIVDNQANLYGTLYFWTHNSMPSASYPGNSTINYNDAEDFAIYNLTGTIALTGLVGTGATSPGNQSPPLGYIAAGQAFFVKSKTASNAIFTNSMRISGNNSQFYKNANVDANIEKHRVWVNFTNTQGAFKQILIGYVTGATNTWDNNYDGETLDGNKYVDFYSINEEKKLAIQGRLVPFDDSDNIPLGYRSAIAGDFTIAIDHTDGDLSNRAIYLEDKKTGLVQDLQTGNYKFTTAIGTFDDRFVLRYGKTLGTDDFENDQNNILISVKNKVIKVESNSNTENLSEVIIFDISGKEVYNKKKIGTNKLEITDLKSSNQVLVVKVILENGEAISKKIIFY
ncbi:hypothetical protein EV144_107288 [Flavobacterium sp. 270]|uniref:T9SS sorting signal type C domain-containing protein n=1 Tax=Flavobacterium sp. 270 TaxID=2512114 RepID=UPI0010667B6D|nr:T9SS sorting signal type C domain-containing protein [Flavobacterium sp. 270]TDW46094.1 hypothetical protein EV144_107288 [Flavobacterium sp. 270]